MSAKHASWSSGNETESPNITISKLEVTGWTPLNVFGLVALITGFICNISVLVTFVKRRSLRNSFGVYIINLLLNETAFILVYGPINLLYAYQHYWALGNGMCMFANFIGYTYETLVIFGHFLIALNRVWAVTFPFSYRTHHTTKFAILLCCSVWLVMNVWYVPVALGSTIVTAGSLPGSLSCDVDTNNVPYIFSELGLFMFPMVLVILSYPYVCYKSFFSDRKQRVAPNSLTISASVPPLVGQPSITVGTVANTNDPAGKTARKIRICGRELSGSTTGFVTLTLMTLSVAVCLLPKETLFTYLIWAESEPPGVLDIFDVLQRLTATIDPILIVLGNTELRTLLVKKLQLVESSHENKLSRNRT